MFRLFVGLDIPDSIRESLFDMTSGIPGVRWIPDENYHITLRFIGEVDRHMAEEVHYALSSVSIPAFDLQLSGIGTFEDRKRTKSLWVGVEKSPELIRMQETVERALVKAGMSRETRRFFPHITLGRCRDVAELDIARFIQAHNLYRSPKIPVSEFCLFSSILTADGSHYTIEADYPTVGAPVEFDYSHTTDSHALTVEAY